MCPDRHRLFSQLDQSVLPASGVIEVRNFVPKFNLILSSNNQIFNFKPKVTFLLSDMKQCSLYIIPLSQFLAFIFIIESLNILMNQP